MNKSIVQAEGAAHHEDTVKADKRAKKIQLPEKTYAAVEKKAKAEGKTPDELAAEVVKEKAEAKPVTVDFPGDAKINDYGFLHFKNGWLENLGWAKGMALKVDKNADGSVTLKKA